MSDLSVSLDIDIWGYGRNPMGRLDNKYLRASYPYVELAQFPSVFKNEPKIYEILRDYLERNHNDQEIFLVRAGYVFFQTREDAELFRGLLYVS